MKSCQQGSYTNVIHQSQVTTLPLQISPQSGIKAMLFSTLGYRIQGATLVKIFNLSNP